MLKEFFIIFCLSIFLVNSINLTTPTTNEGGAEIIANGLSDIMRKIYAKKGSNLFIIQSVNDRYKLNDVLGLSIKLIDSTLSVMIEDVEKLKPLKNRKRNMNIFFFDSVENFNKICQFVRFDYFKMRKLFTLIAIEKLTENEMEEIFRCFMDRLVVNVDLLTLSDNKLDLFTFFPFRNDAECGNTKIVKINSFNGTWETSHFHPKKSKNFHKCPIVAGVAGKSTEPAIFVNNGKVSGVEMEIFEELAKRFNFELKVKVFNESVGKMYDNGTGNGVLARVVRNEADVCLGLTSLQPIRTKFLTETTLYDIHALGIIGEVKIILLR